MTVYIYGTIGETWFGDGVTEKDITEALAREDGDEVVVAINSHGGDLFAGLAIKSILERHDARVVAEIDGLAASAASIIAMGADEIRMPESSMMMIHNPWGITMGDFRTMRESADDLEEMRDSMAKAYSRADVDEGELYQMLDDETWMSADEAVEKGFADTVISKEDDEEEAVAMRIVEQIEERAKVAAKNSDIPTFDKVPTKVVAMVTRRAKTAAGAFRPVASTRGADMQDENKKSEGSTSAPQSQETHVDAAPDVAARDASLGADVVDIEEVRAQERKRCARIRKTARAVGMAEPEIDDIVDKGLPVEASLDLIINAKANAQQQSAGPVRSTNRGVITGGETDVQKLAKGVKASIMGRLNHNQRDPKNEFNGYSLLAMGREWLKRTGNFRSGMGQNEICAALFAGASANVGRHTTADFPEILKDVAHKTMAQRFEEVPTTYPLWTRSGSLSDFRVHHRVKLNQFPRFKEATPEKGTFESATLEETREEIFLSTYGQEFWITRQAIVDDDLGAFTEIPGMMGEAAARSIQFLVSILLNNGDSASDGQEMVTTGNELFHTDHGNLIEKNLDYDGLADARKTFRDQRDPTGEGSLLIAPQFLLVGTDLETDAWELTQAPTRPDQENPNVPNSFSGLTPIVDPNLNYSGADGEDGHWYLAGPQSRSAVEVAGLNGPPTPQITQSGQGTAHGVKFEAFYDAAVRAIEEKSILKSTGA